MKILVGIFLCGLIAVSIIAPRELQANLLAIQDFVDQYHYWAIGVFFVCYILGMLLVFFPVAILTLLGGFLFGPVLGGILNVTGSLLCAILAFIASRYFISDWVQREAGIKLKVVIDGVTKEGWKFVALVRLIPILPFHILNAMLGLTRIKFWEYTLTSFIFMLPVKLTYTYVGSLGEDFVRNPTQVPIAKVLLAGSLMLAVACVPLFLKRFRGGNSERNR